jgi:hypothetical protein
MSFKSGWQKRKAAIREFYLLIRDRKTYILIPLALSILGILLFMFAAEMPVLIPFFYAVF